MTDIQPLAGAPTKRFFVDMLPRDIELDDAILDLVDNSVDGAMRQARRDDREDESRYKGMWCHLRIDGTSFRIEDNCGGIPDTHFDAAFRLGRPAVDRDGAIPTIGVYGIGMKRAIFKMGRRGIVESRFPGHRRKVVYPPDWFDREEDWDLNVEEIEDDEKPVGVTIVVDELLDDVARRFARDAQLNELRRKLGRHFAYIMDLGFEISLNGIPVEPQSVRLKFDADGEITPFAFSASVDGVEISVSIGIFRRLAKEAEIEDETEVNGARPTKDRPNPQSAGVTVICNDRVVLAEDTTPITGWGMGGVPKFHPQFRAIGGQISFKSSDASLLPISTTKRDLDTDTNLYTTARNEVMTGLKAFIALTNKWKRQEDDLNDRIDKAEMEDARVVVAALTERPEATSIRAIPGGKRFIPKLPEPVGRKDTVWIRFSRPRPEVQQLGEALLEDPGEKPSTIGEVVWTDALRRYISE